MIFEISLNGSDWLLRFVCFTKYFQSQLVSFIKKEYHSILLVLFFLLLLSKFDIDSDTRCHVSVQDQWSSVVVFLICFPLHNRNCGDGLKFYLICLFSLKLKF